MGPAHAGCLRSFIETDHQVTLYTYGDVTDAPPGLRLADANLLLREDKLLRYPNGSYAISANLMRYELLRQGLGLYVDCDVFCLRPLEDAPTIAGWEDVQTINNAVLKLPAPSPMLADLCAIQEGWTPPWPVKKVADAAGPVPLVELPWGTTGPRALTFFARKHKIVDQIGACDLFYPVPHTRWTAFFDPDLTIDDVVTSRTRYVHLYYEMARSARRTDIPSASPLGRMLSSLAWRPS